MQTRATGCDVLVSDPFDTDAICRAVQECLDKQSPTEAIRSAVRELVYILTEPETSLNRKR
ncbi:MAG: hypothetical protein IK016_07940 [Lachnospiraceae bacterium]|nr:hypothetical protein [Lachnospiraceae bacterium]